MAERATEVRIYRQAEIPLALRRAALLIQEAAWPTGRPLDERLARSLHDPRSDPLCMLLLHERELVSYLAIPSRLVQHAGVTYRASGLSAVCTHPAHLRRGFAAQLVSAARRHIAVSGSDIGVFTCDPPLVAFYSAQGWDLMPSTVVVGGTRERPLRADTLDKRTFLGFFTPLAEAHRADFEHADVYLELREGDLW